MPIRWNERQLEAIGARGQDILVSAAAGSGKTAVLTQRVLSLLKEGVKPDALLIVTYTQAAAAQLRARIASALEADEDPKIAAIAQELGRAKICTVHAFCTSVLREFFMQAGVEPMFKVLDAPGSIRLGDQAQTEALEEAIALGGESVCDRFAQLGGLEAAAELARAFYETSRARPNSKQWRESLIEAYAENAENPKESAWAKALMEEGRKTFGRCAKWTKAAAEACPCEPLRTQLYEQAEKMAARAGETGYDALFAPFDFVRLTFKRDTDPADKDAVKARYERAKEAVSEALNVPRGEALLADEKMAEALNALGELADGYERIYEQLKESAGGLDFSDLEHRTLRALEDEQVRTTLQTRFAHVFVDEYQDANELQEAILSQVARGDNRFMVGDVKQSIYSFRMAEPSLFVDKYTRFDGAAGKRIDLNENYRSADQVLGFVNHVFDAVMSESVGGVAYDDKQALRPGRGIAGEKTRIALLDMQDQTQPEPGDEAGALLEELTSSQAEAALVAREVKALLGTPVPEGDGCRPAGYGDICILLRSPRTWGSAITEALLKEGIPATGEADSAYYDLSEVRTFLNLLFVIDNRQRDIALIGALTAPYGGFTPAELTHVRAAYQKENLSFFEACMRYSGEAGDDLAARLGGFLEKLMGWRAQARRRTPGAFVRDMLEESGYLAYAGTLPLGNVRGENLRALAARADGYETLSDFLAVAALGDEGSGEGGVAPLPENAEAVRLMSIHRSKGLEFPLVILAGCGKKLNTRDSAGTVLVHKRAGVGLRYCDAEQLTQMDTLSRMAVRRALDADRISEELRVLYVAMTRPVQKLTITAAVKDVGKKAQRALDFYQNNRYGEAGDFLDLILPPLCAHPDGEALRAYASCGVKPPKYDSGFELEIVSAGQAAGGASAAAGAQEVPLQAQMADEWVEKRLGWAYVPPAGALPRKLAVTRLSRTEEEEIPVPDFARDAAMGAPAAERGTALHALMAAIDPAVLRGLGEGDRAAYVEQQFARLVRTGAIGPREAGSITAAMGLAFYQTPLGAAVMESPFVRREQPFNLVVPAVDLGQEDDGRVMLQGVIDLYFENGQGGYTIVDFKTGRVSDEAAKARYGAQVGVYAAALERMTGRRAQGYLYLADRGSVVRVL